MCGSLMKMILIGVDVTLDTFLTLAAVCLIILVMPTLLRLIFGIVVFFGLLFGGAIYCLWAIGSRLIDIVKDLVCK